jgi:dimethylhistidine N-methyltransferase
MRYVPTLDRRDQSATKIHDEFSLAVINGLSGLRKTLPCRYFYDARGSALFEEITQLPEYYPTRTETVILGECAGEIADAVGEDDLLVEFGSGSSRKTEILLDLLADRIVYVPIDVSEAALAEAKARLAIRYPALEVRTILSDFGDMLALPADIAGRRATGFFPGSTIGNFAPRQAARLLAHFRKLLGSSGRLIIGVDLKKDKPTLINAYDDADGVTAAFNLNLLSRINRELGGSFDETSFVHRAIYNEDEGRIEMHLVSERAQDVEASGRTFHFSEGESIHTENSYKYTVDEFRALAADAGWLPGRVWTDASDLFSIHELT